MITMPAIKRLSPHPALMAIGWSCLSCLVLLVGTAHSQPSAIEAGNGSAFFINDDGDLFGWGNNGSGQLGDGGNANRNTPVAPSISGPWRAVSTSLLPPEVSDAEGHTLAIRADGTLWAWGRNNRGQLGTGDQNDRSSPVQISSRADWEQVAAGSNFSVALNDSGRIFVWGDNSFGQLGGAVAETLSLVPVALPDKDGVATNNDTFLMVAAGRAHVLALHGPLGGSFGSIYGWGDNGDFQLGLGHSAAVSGPTLLPGGQIWQFVEAGNAGSFAIDSSAQLYAWGKGYFGELGTGQNQGTDIQVASSPTPAVNNISPSLTFESVSAGGAHTLAVVSGGSGVYGAGSSLGGEIGLSGSFAVFTRNPDLPPSGTTVTEVAAGRDFSAVLTAGGEVLTSGANDLGQLGNGTNDSGGATFGPTSLGAVDLEIESITLNTDPDTVSAGDAIEFDLIVRNNGTGEVAAGEAGAIRLALGFAETFGAEGQLDFTEGATVDLPDSIGPNGAVVLSLTRTLPATVPAGDYRLLAEADTADGLEESEEANNVFATDLLLPMRADLRIELSGPVPATVAAGATLTFDVDIVNDGAGAIPAGAGSGFSYRAVLSEFADESVGTVFELPVDPDAPGAEFPFVSGLGSAGSSDDRKTRTITVTVPESATTGTSFFLGLVVDTDEVVDEESEANNTAFTGSASVTVTGLSLRDGLDVPDPPADNGSTPNVDESQPATLVQSGDGNWFGKADPTAEGPDLDSLSSPALEAGQSAALTFEFDAPREVTFRWKAATSSSQNRLFFGANEVPLTPESQTAPSTLFGQTSWSEVSFIVPKDTPVGFFYLQDVAAPGDRVFIDDLRVGPAVSDPDYVIESINFDAGDYMLQRDRLTLTISGINRGADFPLPGDFAVTAWLSLDQEAGDEDDVELGELNSFQILDNGSEFVYRAEFQLPESLLDSDYYVLARADSTNLVTEFNEAVVPFSDTDNNFAFSETADVGINRAADLRVTRLVGASELPIFVGGPADDVDFNPEAGQGEQTIFGQFLTEPGLGENSELAIRFDVVNEGLSGINAQDYRIRLFLAPSRDTAPENAATVIEIDESAGLAVGASKTFEITTDIPDTVTPGEFYYVGVQVDAAEGILESDEADNVTRSESNNVFVGEVPLEIALNDSLDDPLTQPWEDGFPGAVDGSTSDSPWFGQSSIVQLDSGTAAAAQSGPVPAAGRSEMTTEVDVGDTPRLIRFFWKVSSQRNTETGQFDRLEFSVRRGSSGPFTTIAAISGDVDWTEVTETLTEPGSYTLRWSYVESGDDVRVGFDAGWVDNFSAAAPDFVVYEPGTDTPGLTVDNLVESVGVTGDGVLEPGDSFDVSFDVANLGDGIFQSQRVQIRLAETTGSATNLDWSNSNFADIVVFDGLVSFDDGDDLGTFSQTFEVPADIGSGGTFFVGAWVEYRKSISEGNETNNLQFTDTALVELLPTFTFAEALDTEAGGNPNWPSIGGEWSPAGEGRWFPVAEDPGTADTETFDGTDAVRSPVLGAGQSASLERVIEGPKLLRFHWKSETVPGQNRLELRLNGTEALREFGPEAGTAMRLSGSVDWKEEVVLVPSGTQIVSFVYSKTAENPSDVVRLDNLRIEDATAADLSVKEVSFNPNPDPESGIQQFVLERDQFPLSVTVQNRGETPSGLNYDDVDLEIRFSDDRTIGPDDQIVGNLAVTEILDGGQRLVFAGDLDLPINLAAQRFYLLVRINSLDPGFSELTVDGTELTANNLFASSEQNIEVVHLPRLTTELRGVGLPVGKVYYPKETFRLDWNLLNIGLGDIGGDGQTSYTQTIQLRAFPPGTVEFTIPNSVLVRDLAEIPEDAFLQGVLATGGASPSRVEYTTELALPRAGGLLGDLGVTAVGLEDENAEVISNLDELQEHTFYIAIIRDTDVPQSSNLSINHFIGNRFRVAAYPSNDPLVFSPGEETTLDYGEWLAFNTEELNNALDLGIVPPPITGAAGVDDIGGGTDNLFYYALNLPRLPDTRVDDALGKLNRFGSVFVDGAEYQRITFPIIRGATDLRYIVEAANAPGGPWEEILTIEPPYLDDRSGFRAGYFGAQTLTGPSPSALINQTSPNGGGYLPVVSVIDHNYSATVTVRDYVPLGGAGSRFMQLTIELIP